MGTVAKLDTALGQEVQNRGAAVTGTAQTITKLKQSLITSQKDFTAQENKARAKLAEDVAAKDKAMKTSTQANADAIKKETEARSKEAGNENKLFTAMNKRIEALEAKVAQMSKGSSETKPALVTPGKQVSSPGLPMPPKPAGG